MWYTNYKAKVEMQKLISRNKNGSECSTPLSTQLHDAYVYNKTIIITYIITYLYYYYYYKRLSRQSDWVVCFGA